MKKIYTKTGDSGMTGIFGKRRVPKDDVRIEANGTVDELNALIGVAAAFLGEDETSAIRLLEVQKELMKIMSIVATPSDLRDLNPQRLSPDSITRMEAWMDGMTAEMEGGDHFIIPGGTPASSFLQLARTLARRAERRLWTLHREDPLPEEILVYFNRLSDLLFVTGRYVLYEAGGKEIRWKKFRREQEEKHE